MDQLMRAGEAAQLLGITRRRAYLLGRQGVIPVVRLGERQVRFSASALGAWIAAGGRTPQQSEERGSMAGRESRLP
jgi:excisionase family DNA binding protein